MNRKKKTDKPTKDDLKRQEEIEKRLKKEGVELDHPQGKERFRKVLRQAIKPDSERPHKD